MALPNENTSLLDCEVRETPLMQARQLAKSSSVILAHSGKKVSRSDSFFNTEFESFNDSTILDSDSDSYSGAQEPVTLAQRVQKYKHEMKTILDGQVTRNVLKCAVAYLIASLGVYYSPFSAFLGNTDSKHVAATTAVYFHPARTKGSMHQSVLFVLLSLSFTFSLSLACRTVSSYYFNVGEDEVSYTIDLVVSSIGLGVIAFMKQKVNRDTFNTACSLASISLVTCIVKEGSLNSNTIPMMRLFSTSRVVITGAMVSVVICYVLWPKSAVNQLRHSLNDSFNIMSSLVSVVTHRFLHGEKISAKDSTVFASLRKKSAELTKNLEEARYELFLVGKEDEYASYCDIVDATNSLMEHLHALRSSCEMQGQVLREDNIEPPHDSTHESDSRSVTTRDSRQQVAVSESVENLGSLSFQDSGQETEVDYHAVYSTQLFDLFVYYLAPSVKSLVFTVKEVMAQVPFEKTFVNDVNQSFFAKSSNYQNSLHKAIELFETKQVQSFDKLYSQKIFETNSLDFKTDQEEVTACCGNFTSLIALYGRQLIRFLQLTEEFEIVAKKHSRSWKWMKFWCSAPTNPSKRHAQLEASFVDALHELKLQLRPLSTSDPGFPGTVQKESLRLKLWRFLSVFKRTDVQFGIRVGVGAFCISVFAFLPQTKSFFVDYRLEWTLAIYCIMMSKSLGATNMTVKWRFLGTFLGAFLAYIAWLISDANAIVLASTGFLLSLPCFYIIIYWKSNNAYGRFILLAYNLTALYSYSMASNDSEDGKEGGDRPIVGEIAVHRFLSVSIGIIWALVVANVFLRNSARSRLKSGLTILWLRMGVVWNSDPMDYNNSSEGCRLTGLKDYSETRKLLIECQTLCKQAPLEFRLKGKFPTDIYEKLLKSTSSILDAFSNLQLMIEVDPTLVPNEEYVLKYIESEREELEQRIFLTFYMVASAIALGFPLPTKPASTEHAKDRLLLKLSEFRTQTSTSKVDLTNEDYVLLYSYLLVTSTITKELDTIFLRIKDLLGNVSEDLFWLA